MSQIQNEVEFILELENMDQDFLNSQTWVGDRTSVSYILFQPFLIPIRYIFHL